MKLLCNLVFLPSSRLWTQRHSIFQYVKLMSTKTYQSTLIKIQILFPNSQPFLWDFYNSFSIYKALIRTKFCFWIEYSLLDWKLHASRSIYCSHCMPIIYVSCSVQLKETQVSKGGLEFLQRTDSPDYLKLILPKFVTPS